MHLQPLFLSVCVLSLVVTGRDDTESWFRARQQASYEQGVAPVGDISQHSVYDELMRRSNLERRLVSPYSVPRYSIIDLRYAELYTIGNVHTPLHDLMVNLVRAIDQQLQRHLSGQHVAVGLGGIEPPIGS